MPRILLPIEGYERGALIPVTEYAKLAQHEREIKTWLGEQLPNQHIYAELKCASAFPGELDRQYHWAMAVWFLGDNAVQQAVKFKLTWGGHVFRRD